MTDSKTTISDVGISRTNLISETFNVFTKRKRKRHKHKLLDEMKNTSDCNIQVSAIDKSGTNIILDVRKIMDKHKKTEADNIFDCETADSNVIGITKNDLNNENCDRFHKKKKKHKLKLFDEVENVSDCKTSASNAIGMDQNGLNNETLNAFHKKKKKKHKLLDEMKIKSDCNIQESAIDISGTHMIFDVYKRIDELKQAKAVKISDSKTADSSVIELNENDINNENFGRFHKKKKKKKHKLKLFDEVENISDCKTADSNAIDMNRNNLNSETLNGFRKKKKKKHKLFDEMENVSDCNFQESAIAKSGTNRIFDVYKSIDEHEQTKSDEISDCKTADSSVIELNENDISNDIFHKKKKKRTYKLLDEMENTSNCKTADSNAIDMNRNNLNTETLNEFHKKKKKKHKLLDEMEIISDCDIEVSTIDELEKNRMFDVLDIPKRINKCKTIDSNAIEINQNNLSSVTFDEPCTPKRKKHRHKLHEVEIMSKTIIESNNSSNNSMYHEHMKEVKEKSVMSNVVDGRPPRMNRKSKECFESGDKVISDNLPEKEKNVTCKGHEKEKNYQEDEDIYMSFDPFLFDMNEVHVPFPIPELHEGETAATLKPERKAYLEENGVTIHTGKWTKTEDDILTRNFLQFGLEFGINNPFQLLGINQSKKDDKLTKFLRAKHFLIRLGKDLGNRSLRSIYMRARKLFNPLKNKEKLSAQEASDLKFAHQMVGNKWTRISDMLSRSDSNCYSAFRWHKNDINKGMWTPEEESNLMEAIKTVTGEEDISANNVKNIPWKAVAKYVPTRNEFQCHKQWAEHLAWDSSITEKEPWQKYHFGKLIYLIKDKYCFNSESEIDFEELHRHFKHVTPSYIFLRKKWLYMKGRLPKELKLSYSKSLDALTRMYEEQYKLFANE